MAEAAPRKLHLRDARLLVPLLSGPLLRLRLLQVALLAVARIAASRPWTRWRVGRAPPR